MDTKSLPPYEANNDSASIRQQHQNISSSSLPHIRSFRHLLVTLLKCHQAEQSHIRPSFRNGNPNFLNLDYDPSSRPVSSHLDSSFDHVGKTNEVQNKEEDHSLALLHIGPLIQPIHIEPRAQDVSSFNVNADLLCIFGDGRNRWLNYSKKPDTPPQPLRLPRFIMSPSLCSLWLSKLSPSALGVLSTTSTPLSSPHINPSNSLTGLDLTHLIITTGQAGTEIRKFIATDSLHDAASTIFNELANGYSVVFVGTMLKSEFEMRMVKGRAYQICKGVEELLFWANTSSSSGSGGIVANPTRDEGSPFGKGKKLNKEKDRVEGDEGRRCLGIIC